jgi:hypothetical protein
LFAILQQVSIERLFVQGCTSQENNDDRDIIEGLKLERSISQFLCRLEWVDFGRDELTGSLIGYDVPDTITSDILMSQF